MPSKKRNKKQVSDLKAKTLGRKDALKVESVRGGSVGMRYGKVDLEYKPR